MCTTSGAFVTILESRLYVLRAECKCLLSLILANSRWMARSMLLPVFIAGMADVGMANAVRHSCPSVISRFLMLAHSCEYSKSISSTFISKFCVKIIKKRPIANE